MPSPLPQRRQSLRVGRARAHVARVPSVTWSARSVSGSHAELRRCSPSPELLPVAAVTAVLYATGTLCQRWRAHDTTAATTAATASSSRYRMHTGISVVVSAFTCSPRGKCHKRRRRSPLPSTRSTNSTERTSRIRVPAKARAAVATCAWRAHVRKQPPTTMAAAAANWRARTARRSAKRPPPPPPWQSARVRSR